jgi:hypothetical protein
MVFINFAMYHVPLHASWLEENGKPIHMRIKGVLPKVSLFLSAIDIIPKMVIPLLFKKVPLKMLCPAATALFRNSIIEKSTILMPIVNSVFHWSLAMKFCSYEILPKSMQKYFSDNFHRNNKEYLNGDNTLNNERACTERLIGTAGQLCSEIVFLYTFGTLNIVSGGLVIGTGALQLYALHYKWFA